MNICLRLCRAFDLTAKQESEREREGGGYLELLYKERINVWRNEISEKILKCPVWFFNVAKLKSPIFKGRAQLHYVQLQHVRLYHVRLCCTMSSSTMSSCIMFPGHPSCARPTTQFNS